MVFFVAQWVAAHTIKDKAKCQDIISEYNTNMDELVKYQGITAGGWPIFGEGNFFKGKGLHYDAPYTIDHVQIMSFATRVTNDQRWGDMMKRWDEVVPHMVGISEAIYVALYQIVDNAVIAAGAKGMVSMYTKFYDRFNQLQVTVADNGEGIDREGVLKSALETEVLNPKQAVEIRQDTADHNNKIFELIFKPRVSTFVYDDKSHKGIGLALAFEEISKHGGKIEIYSKPGRGTTIQIYLNILTWLLNL